MLTKTLVPCGTGRGALGGSSKVVLVALPLEVGGDGGGGRKAGARALVLTQKPALGASWMRVWACGWARELEAIVVVVMEEVEVCGKVCVI